MVMNVVTHQRRLSSTAPSRGMAHPGVEPGWNKTLAETRLTPRGLHSACPSPSVSMPTCFALVPMQGTLVVRLLLIAFQWNPLQTVCLAVSQGSWVATAILQSPRSSTQLHLNAFLNTRSHAATNNLAQLSCRGPQAPGRHIHMRILFCRHMGAPGQPPLDSPDAQHLCRWRP